MLSVVSRQGRELQMYGPAGIRLVVGCIPYRLNIDNLNGSNCDINRSLEVLVISSQKGNTILFPKGGWESDESMEEAALREAFEEAGVQGNLEDELGRWTYKSRRYDAVYEGCMFPMNVTMEYGQWPEKEARQRKWVTAAEAREGCPHLWMREALDELMRRLSSSGRYQPTSV